MKINYKFLIEFFFDMYGILNSIPGIEVSWNKNTHRFILQYRFYLLDVTIVNRTNINILPIILIFQVYDSKTREVINIVELN